MGFLAFAFSFNSTAKILTNNDEITVCVDDLTKGYIEDGGKCSCSPGKCDPAKCKKCKGKCNPANCCKKQIKTVNCKKQCNPANCKKQCNHAKSVKKIGHQQNVKYQYQIVHPVKK